jgi:hypothetical protein
MYPELNYIAVLIIISLGAVVTIIHLMFRHIFLKVIDGFFVSHLLQFQYFRQERIILKDLLICPFWRIIKIFF